MASSRFRTAVVLSAWLVAGGAVPAAAQDFVVARFEQYMEALRQQTGIPGLAAAIVHDGAIVWEKGFGFADVDRGVPAMPDTLFHVGGLTQSFSSVLALQCVEMGRIRLTDPIQPFGVTVPEAGAAVGHILTHTSEGAPGVAFRYSLERIAALTPVVDSCLGRYREILAENILERLAMFDSVPGQDLALGLAAVPPDMFNEGMVARYVGALQRLAVPYRVDARGRASASAYPEAGINAAIGLVSTVRDLARFDAGLDQAVLLRPETLTVAWANPLGLDGQRLPHGLGWFVQTYNGTTLVWQYGHLPDAGSALVIKVPARRLTLVLLANSDGLAAPFQLSRGDVTTSLFAQVFLRLFL
ncbi:MAG: beta-lactamase family protein [Acidobacteria bacterium]|nr:beta-lactamase family protein [Acidobacteriota bacterium]